MCLYLRYQVCFDGLMWVRAIAAALLFVLALIFAAPVAGTVYSMRQAAYECIAGSPAFRKNDVPQGTQIVGAAGEISQFPLGIRCILTANDGSTAVTEPGWVVTVYTGASLTALAAASIMVDRANVCDAHSVRGRRAEVGHPYSPSPFAPPSPELHPSVQTFAPRPVASGH
jgi:hypothetical protein